MQGWKALLSFLLITAVIFIGCGEDEDGNGNGAENVDVEILSGTITEDMTLTKDKQYLLRGGVFIGDDENRTVLTIEPGVTVYGESATKGMLVIRRNSQIIADGTPLEPIIFTSDKPVGQRSRGDWGGLIINGRAPLNTGPEAYGEGGTGYYGGTDPNDNSGVLRYVRVEFAGREISPDNELNGIAFQGVGSGTTVEYIQVHMNKDDGVEFFGGTCNAKYILLTGIADDCFDWTDGWQGKVQYVVAQQYPDDADQGIEADNNGEDNLAQPNSNPKIYNLTLIGAGTAYGTTDESDIGILLREGTQGEIYNGIIMGFGDYGLDVDHEATFNHADSKELIVDHCIFYDNNKGSFSDDDDTEDAVFDFDEENFATATNTNNLEVSESPVVNPYDMNAPDYKPQGDALSHTPKSPSDGFFDSVNFIGGVDPGNDWTVGWAIHSPN